MVQEETLAQLQQKVSMKNQLEAKRNELHKQRWEFDKKVISLRVAYHMEQEDVEKLEGRSLANYFFQVIGKLDDKLDKERQEAYAAKVKLDAAEQELAAIEAEIQEIQGQLAEIAHAEETYQKAMLNKRLELRNSGTAEGEMILELEEKIRFLESRKQEIREAIRAGQSARGTADRILSELNDADNWNTWDLLGGGGIVTHVAKHGHLDEAQDLIGSLQSKLRKFQTELADVQIRSGTQVNVDGFLRFADYFFDGLFADWAVGKQIQKSYSSVEHTKSQINQALRKLEDLESASEKELKLLKAQLEERIVNA